MNKSCWKLHDSEKLYPKNLRGAVALFVVVCYTAGLLRQYNLLPTLLARITWSVWCILRTGSQAATIYSLLHCVRFTYRA